VTIAIEPEVRAGFVGTSNTQTDATGFTSNAQVGYLYTDYNGLDRSLFNFRNDTSPNVAFTGNVFNWTWGDTTSNTGLITFANVAHSYLTAVGSPTTGTKTVALQANGTPGTISQTSTQTRTAYITILANPTAPTNLSGFSNVTIANTSQGTSPLLAAGATDNTGGNIVQTTFYPLVLYNRVEKDFRYTFIGGKWIMDSLNITPGKSSKTTIYEPAINLILVN
jgi:hypothetical protein